MADLFHIFVQRIQLFWDLIVQMLLDYQLLRKLLPVILWLAFSLHLCKHHCLIIFDVRLLCTFLTSYSFRVFAIVQVTWHSVGILLASISTIVYIFIQVFQKYLSNIYQYFMLQKVFGHSWKNMHLRCCHILYWPIILQDRSLR